MLKPYTTRMAKIQGPKEGKTYSNVYKEKWTQPWPMGSKIYPEVHENPMAFFSSFSPILFEPLAHGSGDWSLPMEDCINIPMQFPLKNNFQNSSQSSQTCVPRMHFP